ncbi:hypothetical protein pb186bvf_018657 [Paramecium bursaria]
MYQIPKWMEWYGEAFEIFSFNALGGPKLIQPFQIVDFFKGTTAVYLLILMHYFQNFSSGAYLYLVLHGSYGFIWVTKDIICPDFRARIKQSLSGSIFLILLLVYYWIIGFIQISGYGINNPSKQRISIVIISYVSGVFLMTVTDIQKYYTLKFKKGLITEGIVKHNRNPNFLGESLIYGSFAIATGNDLCYLIVWSSFIIIFLSRMISKDCSLAKKNGWEQYKKQSHLFLWQIGSNKLLSYSIYLITSLYIYVSYSTDGLIANIFKDL